MTPLFKIQSNSATDVIMATMLPRAIARGTSFNVRPAVQSYYPELWYENPFISSNFGMESTPEDYYEIIDVKDTSLASMAELALRFDVQFERDFDMEPWPALYMESDEYVNGPSARGSLEGRPYWLLCCGTYTRWPEWNWDVARWQLLSDILTHDESFPLVAQVGLSKHCSHPVLKRCVSLLDRTDLRDLMWLCRHANGVICNEGCISLMALAMGTKVVSIGPACRSSLLSSNYRDLPCELTCNMDPNCGCMKVPRGCNNVDPTIPTVRVPSCLYDLTPRALARAITSIDRAIGG